ncbi:MAG: hypothetical protein QOE92_11 [Chloroflexota bacterium]|jgi:hypothetical protein|nr:hypothetical protein [Chloroflexota bacterium]
MPPDRWLQVGRSDEVNAYHAGAAAASDAMGGPDARLLIVFCSHTYDLPELLRGIRESVGDVPLVGCSTAGEIANSGPGDAGVVVTALGGPGFSVATAAVPGVSGRLREASAEVAGCIEDVEPYEHRVLLLLTDGLSGDQEEVIRGAYSVVGAGVPLVGGCAGDDLRMRRTFQVHGAEVMDNGIVAAAIASNAPFGIGVRHGWSKVGDAMLVTRSAGNRVYSLNDRPALDVYLERLQAPVAARADHDEFTHFALTHPLGLSRRSGEEVRFIGDANFDDRSLGCIAAVPQGGLTWIMEGDADSVLAATEDSCHQALAQLGGRPPLGLVAFDCIARRGVLGDEGIRGEVSRLGALAGGAPVAGFYTYGEIARTHSLRGFHNQTLVVLAFA